jgi:protein-S-isoprenylcysteine O-methyltransferase Ste14
VSDFDNSLTRWVQRRRVLLGFLCGFLFIALARPRPSTLVIGGLIALCGLALRAWAAGHIRKNTELTVTGPYAYTRNPLYLGSFLLCVGFAVAGGRLIVGAVFAAVFLGIYWPVMRVEEGHLRRAFGENYDRYAARVPLFAPRLFPFRDDLKESEAKRERKFDAQLYLRYREYRAALGAVFAWTVLVAKILLTGYFSITW